MRRLYNQDYQQPTDFWSGLLSGFMQGREERKQKDQEMAGRKVLGDLYSTDFTAQQPQAQPGLLTSSVLPNTGQQLADPSLNAAQQATDGENPQLNIMSQEPVNLGYEAPKPLSQQQATIAPINAQQTPQAPQTWQQQEAQYKKAYASKLQELYKNKDVDNATLAQALPQLNNMFKDQLSQAKTAYHQQILSDPNADIRTKIQAAMNMGMKADDIKLLLQKGYTNQSVQDLQDRKMPTAFDPYTGQLINTMTGKPVTQEELKMGINPNTVYTQEQTNARYDRPSGNAIYNKNTVGADTIYKVQNAPVRSSGGGSGSKEYNQKWQQYKYFSGYDNVPTGEVDFNGKPLYKKVQRNPEMAKQLESDLFSGGQQAPQAQSQPSSNNDNAAAYNAEYQDLVGRGFTSDEAYQYLTEKYR